MVTRCLASFMFSRYHGSTGDGQPCKHADAGVYCGCCDCLPHHVYMGSATEHRVIVRQTSASLCLSVTCLTSSMAQELVTKKMELAEINEECLKTRHDLLWEQQKCSALESKLAKTENIVYAKSSANPLSSFNPSRLFH